MEEPEEEITSVYTWNLSITQYLDRLNESVEENSDTDRPTQELDESGRSEESEEADLNNSSGVDDATGHGDEVKGVPGVFEIWLERRRLIRL